MKTVPIFKYHGLGNDFVVVSRAHCADPVRLAKAVCDRHRGVGADGLLVLSEEESAAARMAIYNRDGSRPEMCGNGVRCVVRHLVAVDGQEPDDLTILSDAGPRHCRVVDASAGTWQVAVDMGRAEVTDETVAIEQGAFEAEATKVDVGNPHAVVFESPPLATVDAVGEALNDAHPDFPEGVNVEFVEKIGPQAIRVVVYERGVGRTMACGTGACAAAIAAARRGLCGDEAPIEVELPGGHLKVELRDGTVWMTGPVEYVFHGELTGDWLQANE